ncbi:hypothetical protein M6B38_386030 [Iris pallida]|uniref:Uncharacterized protein n=1 Tax=Iris pallida TaxID=29817 RepID=A0AAX6G2L6_IRIPA|nr:hypothetical protein M6B38_386030 [Iris pallida]
MRSSSHGDHRGDLVGASSSSSVFLRATCSNSTINPRRKDQP